MVKSLMGLTTSEANALSERAKDYLEAIHNLMAELGYARVGDIATKLQVNPSSVSSMLRKLDERKLVTHARYEDVELTAKGKILGETIAQRRRTLKTLWIIMGASEESAEKDASETKHKMTAETVEKLAKFVEFIELAPQAPPFLEHFKHYVRTGKRPKHCRAESVVEEDSSSALGQGPSDLQFASSNPHRKSQT
jgi:Mn-dependent DtxR family transcriptional regulator